MPRNGNGVYNLPASSWNPAVTDSTIESSGWNTTGSDLASALTQSVSKDGQTTMTGNLPMGNNKLTGLGNGSAATDSINYGQAAKLSGGNTFSGDQVINGSVSLSGSLNVTGPVIFTSGTITVDNLKVSSIASIANLNVASAASLTTVNISTINVSSTATFNVLGVASVASLHVLNVASVASVASLRVATGIWNAGFSARPTSSQAGILPSTNTKVNFGTEDYDLGGYYDTGTSRFTPLVAGKYQFSIAVNFTVNVVANNIYTIWLFKNASAWAASSTIAVTTTQAHLVLTTVADANGSTDYFEVQCFGAGAGNKTVGADPLYTFFQAARIG